MIVSFMDWIAFIWGQIFLCLTLTFIIAVTACILIPLIFQKRKQAKNTKLKYANNKTLTNLKGELKMNTNLKHIENKNFSNLKGDSTMNTNINNKNVYLEKILTSNFTRNISAPSKPAENASALQPPKPKFEPKPFVSLTTLFAKDGVSVTPNENSINFELLANLSETIAKNLKVFQPFLSALRTAMTQKREFNIDFSDCEPDESEQIRGLLLEMQRAGMFSKYFYDGLTKIAKGKVSIALNPQNFIRGKFYEIFAYNTVKKVLEEIARANGFDYEIAPNVLLEKVINSSVKNELDLLFRVDDVVFWAEVKSGETFNDYDKVYSVGKRYKFNPDRHILLLSDTDNLNVDVIENMYRFFLADSESFEDKVRAMVTKALKTKISK